MNKLKLLLISNSTDPEIPLPINDNIYTDIANEPIGRQKYLLWPRPFIEDFCKKYNVKKVLFIPFAGVNLVSESVKKSYDEYENKVKSFYAKFGIKLYSIHKEKKPIEAIIKAEAVAVGGGNTFYLVNELHRLGLMKPLRERALNGMPYMGWSAGSNITCPTLMTTNDMPIIQPQSFDCLNLLPFQINPHYLDANPEGFGGETREVRIKEFITVNRNTTVVGLRERCLLEMENGNLLLKFKDKTSRPDSKESSNYKLIIFKYNKDAGKQITEYSATEDLNFLLK